MAKLNPRKRFSARKNRPLPARSAWLIAVTICIAAGTLGFLLLHSNASASQDGELAGIEPGIVWYGVLKDGLAEAQESGKPILLVSAAPNCAGVSGLW